MNRRLLLINWVRAQHEGQLIRQTDQPYFDHVAAIANTVNDVGPLTYEIGLCNDLLEKTNVTELAKRINRFWIYGAEATHISSCIAELTRQFTKKANPLPKKERKILEDERLMTISANAQTVKYADLLYNADWMMQYDRHHTGAYLRRMTELVSKMTAGDPALREQVLKHLAGLIVIFKN